MKRRDEVLVGMVSTVSIVMGFIGALWLARGGLAPGYPLYSKFAWGAGLKQGDAVALPEQMMRGPGAEHAGADDGNMAFAARRRGTQNGRSNRPGRDATQDRAAGEGERPAQRLAAPYRHRQKALRTVTPIVRGDPTLKPSRARPPRSRSNESRGFSSKMLLA